MKPKELPEARAEMLNYFRDGFGRTEYTTIATIYGMLGNSVSPGEAEYLFDEEVDRWQRAELFYVTEDMTDLAMAAAQSMPTFTLQASDLPSEYGVIYFAKPIGSSRADRELGAVPVVAVAWGQISTEMSPRPGLWLSYYVDKPAYSRIELEAVNSRGWTPAKRADFEAHQRSRGPFVYDDEAFVGYGLVADENLRPGDPDTIEGWAYTLRCAWLLMQQTIASVHEERADRSSRRRMERAGHAHTPVRVISLRYAASSNYDTPGDREYHHRWMVRGHWRNQWYPSQQRHVPLWISPHVKGPDDAPLLGGEKVYAWRR